jgi:hypothetical protein
LGVRMKSPPRAIFSRRETYRCVPTCQPTSIPAGALTRG